MHTISYDPEDITHNEEIYYPLEDLDYDEDPKKKSVELIEMIKDQIPLKHKPTLQRLLQLSTNLTPADVSNHEFVELISLQQQLKQIIEHATIH